MAFFWKRKQEEMEIPPPPQKSRISIPSDLPSFPSSREEKLPPLPPLEKKPEPPILREEARKLPLLPKLGPLPPLPKLEPLPPLPKLEELPQLPRLEPLPPLPPLPSLEPEREIKRAVGGPGIIPKPEFKSQQQPIIREAPKPIFREAPKPFLREMPRPIIRQEMPRPTPRHEIPRGIFKPAPERIIQKEERFERFREERPRKLKRGLLRENELFIEVEDYRIIYEILTNLRKNVSNLSESIEKMEGSSGEEEALLEKWQKSLDLVQKRVMSVDKSLFR